MKIEISKSNLRKIIQEAVERVESNHLDEFEKIRALEEYIAKNHPEDSVDHGFDGIEILLNAIESYPEDIKKQHLCVRGDLPLSNSVIADIQGQLAKAAKYHAEEQIKWSDPSARSWLKKELKGKKEEIPAAWSEDDQKRTMSENRAESRGSIYRKRYGRY